MSDLCRGKEIYTCRLLSGFFVLLIGAPQALASSGPHPIEKRAITHTVRKIDYSCICCELQAKKLTTDSRRLRQTAY